MRVRQQGKKGDTVTTPANLRMYTLNDLERGTLYQIRLWAINVNGTGPPTEWLDVETYENDLDESRVPDAPENLRGMFCCTSYLFEDVTELINIFSASSTR